MRTSRDSPPHCTAAAARANVSRESASISRTAPSRVGTNRRAIAPVRGSGGQHGQDEETPLLFLNLHTRAGHCRREDPRGADDPSASQEVRGGGGLGTDASAHGSQKRQLEEDQPGKGYQRTTCTSAAGMCGCPHPCPPAHLALLAARRRLPACRISSGGDDHLIGMAASGSQKVGPITA